VRGSHESHEISGYQVALSVDREVATLEIVQSAIVYLHDSPHRTNDAAMCYHQYMMCSLSGTTSESHEVAQCLFRPRKHQVGCLEMWGSTSITQVVGPAGFNLVLS
jgi:hypothetical protein